MPTGAFKPVEPAQPRGKKAARVSSASPVRRILEGASKKLRKSQSPDAKRRPHRAERAPTGGRGDRGAKPRERTDPRRAQRERERKGKSTHAQAATTNPRRVGPRPREAKPQRRSSMRLKTLAKVLGRKRPNYSLVLSGYADVEEYEEEQKKKAAKSALAKAKAEARARARVGPGRKSGAAPRPAALRRAPEKMRTRSSSGVSKEGEETRPGGDRERVAGPGLSRPGDRERAGPSGLSRPGDNRERAGPSGLSRPGDNRERAGPAGLSRPGLGLSRPGDRERGGPGLLKRSLSAGSAVRKEQTPLATIVETKRLKREAEGREDHLQAGARRHSSARDGGGGGSGGGGRKSAPSTPPQPKKGH